MGGPKTIRKSFNSFEGLDIGSSDLVRSPDAAIEIENAMFSTSMDLTNRPGTKIYSPNAQFLGLWTHTHSNTTTGAVEEEIISIGQQLSRRRSNSITIAYAGVATICQLNIYLVPGTTNAFYVTLLEGTTTVLNFSLGTGLEGTPITLANLKTAVDAVAGFSCTIVGTTSTPAALVLPTSLDLDLSTAPKSQTIKWYDWQAINETVSNTFGTYYGNRGNTDFLHASAANASNCLLVATGYEYLMQYDGQTVFRAGLPEPVVPTLALGGAGGPTGTYTYVITAVQVDNRGNRIEGTESVLSSSIAPVNQWVNVTVPNILTGSGYNTNYAQVNGVQAGVTTITVNAGHTIKVGDSAFFFDSLGGSYITRTVTAIGATTIAISGAAVNVANAMHISNNLKIAIYRNKNGGIDYFLVTEIPNNPAAATQVYADTKVDSALGLQYLFASSGRDHDLLPVKPRFITVHQNQLICAGDISNPDTIYISLPGEPWYHPIDGGNADIVSTRAGGISGLASDGTFLIAGKEIELFVGSGDFSEPGAYRFERLNQSIGFACHNAIAEIGDGLVFLSRNGFYLIRGGSQISEVGRNINKYFTDEIYSSSQTLQLKRAWAQYWDAQQLFICYIPKESGTGTSRYANDESQTFVFDAYFKGWLPWKALNAGGGICLADNSVWFQSKRTESVLTVTGNLLKLMQTGTKYDYADHDQPINWKFSPQWEDGGEPSVFKLATRAKFYSLIRDVLVATFSLRVTTEIDYNYGTSHSDFTIDFGSVGGLGYGFGAWGPGVWGTPATVSRVYKLRVGKFRAIRFVFSHSTIHQKIALSGWEYELIDKYRREMKS